VVLGAADVSVTSNGISVKWTGGELLPMDSLAAWKEEYARNIAGGDHG